MNNEVYGQSKLYKEIHLYFLACVQFFVNISLNMRKRHNESVNLQ